jgi:hypothetical protein
MLQAKLKVVGGRHHGKTIPLATKKFLIGREQDCHLRPNSELISRHHCVFTVDDFSVHLRDLGSTNGSFVNNQRVQGELLLKSGDRVRVGKLDFEVLIGDAAARGGDSSQVMRSGLDASGQETVPLQTTDTSFEIPLPGPDDTGSSILPPENTPVPNSTPAADLPSGDSTVVFVPPAPPAAPGYAPDPYAPMSMPYPQQQPYQSGYPYMQPNYGYQPQLSYPQIPMGYPGMYPQQMYPQQAPPMGMYPPPNQMPSGGPAYAPPAAATAEPPADETEAMPTVRLPDPKTTGAKAPAPPPEPPKAAAPESTEGTGNPEDEWTKKPKVEEKAPVVETNPSTRAADILKNYTQRRPT